MGGFLDGLFKEEDHGRQDGNAAENAHKHAFNHNDSKISAKGEGHEQKSGKPGDSSGGSSGNGSKCARDGLCHSIFPMFIGRLQFFITAQQEDGVIHSDA